MSISVKPLPRDIPAEDIVRHVREALTDLEDQLNQRGQIYVSTDGKIPAGLNRSDVLIISNKGQISLLIKNKSNFDRLTAEMILGLSAKGTTFKGVTTTGAAATVTEYPNSLDWGFHNRTGGSPSFSLVFNIGAVIKSVALT